MGFNWNRVIPALSPKSVRVRRIVVPSHALKVVKLQYIWSIKGFRPVYGRRR